MITNSTKRDFAYYVTNLDWGDGSALEFTDNPKQFDRIDNFQHTYVMPGFYSIKGLIYKKALYMINLFPDPVESTGTEWNTVETQITREDHDGVLNSVVNELVSKENQLGYMDKIGMDADKIGFVESSYGGYLISEVYNTFTNIIISPDEISTDEVNPFAASIEVQMSAKDRDLTDYTQTRNQGIRMHINILMDPDENNYMDYSFDAWLPNFGRIEIIPESEAPSGDDFFPPNWSPPVIERALQLQPIPGTFVEAGDPLDNAQLTFDSWQSSLDQIIETFSNINSREDFLSKIITTTEWRHLGNNLSMPAEELPRYLFSPDGEEAIWQMNNSFNPLGDDFSELRFRPNKYNSKFSEVRERPPVRAPGGWRTEIRTDAPSEPAWVEYQSPVPSFPEGRGQSSAPPNFLWPPSVNTANLTINEDIEPRDINEGGQQFFGWNGRNQPIDEGGLLDIFGKYEINEANEKIGKGYLANELHQYFREFGVIGISNTVPDSDKPNSDQIQHNGVTAGVGLWKLDWYSAELFDGTDWQYDNYDPWCNWIINEDSLLWTQAIGATSNDLDGRNDGGRWIWTGIYNEFSGRITNYEWTENPMGFSVNQDGQENPIDQLSEDQQWKWDGEGWISNYEYEFDVDNEEPTGNYSEDNQWQYVGVEADTDPNQDGWIRNDISIDNPTGWVDNNPIGEHSSDGQWIWNGEGWDSDETFDRTIPNPEFNPTQYQLQVIGEKATEDYEPLSNDEVEAEETGRYLYSTEIINGTNSWKSYTGNFYTNRHVRRLYLQINQLDREKDTYGLDHANDAMATDIWKFYLKNIEIRFQNTENIEQPLQWEKFQSNMVVNSTIDYESPVYPDNNFIMIGGLSKDSYHYKSLLSLVGYDYKTGNKRLNFSYDRYNPYDVIMALDTVAKYDVNLYDDYLTPYTKTQRNETILINTGMVKKESHGSFQNTNLTDTDIGTAKIYTGVVPMWKQLGFANDEFDIPNRNIYWKNIIPKDFDLSERVGITQRDLPDPMKGSLTPRIPRKEFIVDEEATQYWNGGYHWPALPKFNKLGVLSNNYPQGTEGQTYGKEDAPITNTNDAQFNKILNLFFEDEEIVDIDDNYAIELNTDFSVKLDLNSRMVKNQIQPIDSIDKNEIKQAF